MRKLLICAMALLLAPASSSYASDIGFSIGFNYGYPGPTVPAYAPQPVYIGSPPEFIEPPELGFYVAVGVPYNLFFINGFYYLSIGNIWYMSPYYNGPWQTVYYYNVPYALHRYPFARIHYYRDYYYRRYHEYGDWRGHNHFRPEWHGRDWDRRRGTGPAYRTPDRPNHNSWNRSYYGRQSRPDQGNWNRPANNVHATTNRGAWSRQTPGRPVPGNWSRPAYNTPSRPAQGNWNRPAYAAPDRRGQGNWNRPAYSNPGGADRGNFNRPAYNRSPAPYRGNAGRQVNVSPNNGGHGDRHEGRGR